MIDYTKVSKGDILKIVGEGAPGFAQLGDLVRVIEVRRDSVRVEDRHGNTANFMYTCGAARLEDTEYKNDFPKTNRELHEEAAGMPLDDMFFRMNGIDPNAIPEEDNK